jgi:hypothetical protein
VSNIKEIDVIFSELNSLNVNNYTQKKGQFTYLSWAWAVRELLKVSPDATWKIHQFGYDGVSCQPYMQTEAGCFVQVTVTVNGIDRTQVHPVLDNRNQTIEKPNAFQVNTSIQRCLAKAIALHGLGLYIYAGEDLPHEDPISRAEEDELISVAAAISEEMEEQVSTSLTDGSVNRANYKGSLAKLKRMMKEGKS